MGWRLRRNAGNRQRGRHDEDWYTENEDYDHEGHDYISIGPGNIIWPTTLPSPTIPDSIGVKPWPPHRPTGPIQHSSLAEPIAGPTSIQSSTTGLPSKSSTTNGGMSPSTSYQHQNHDPHHTGILIVAAVVPLLVCMISGILLFLYLRRRKHRCQQPETVHAKREEMETQNNRLLTHPEFTIPHPPAVGVILPPVVPLPRPVAPRPAILRPVMPSSSGAYYTGIDTSDVVSILDHPVLVNPFIAHGDRDDEPPPPYRPRSIAPVTRSPFEDPQDEDVVSIVSEPALGLDGGHMSDISDLSYQQHAVVTQATIEGANGR